MQKFVSETFDSLMYLSNPDFGFAPIGRSFLFPGEVPLGYCQLLFCLDIVLGVLDSLAGGESDQTLQANIYANGGIGFYRLWIVYLSYDERRRKTTIFSRGMNPYDPKLHR